MISVKWLLRISILYKTHQWPKLRKWSHNESKWYFNKFSHYFFTKRTGTTNGNLKGLYTLTSTVIQVWGPEVIILHFLIPILYSPVAGLFGVSSVHVKQVFSFCCCGVMLKLVYSCKMIGPFLCTDSNFRWPVKGWNAIVCANSIMGIQAVLYEGTVRRNWNEEIE